MATGFDLIKLLPLATVVADGHAAVRHINEAGTDLGVDKAEPAMRVALADDSIPFREGAGRVSS
jgi:hypothetical protein